ncbi:MAG: hypothetical protein ACLGPL_03680, partial [Acidobacteriota bacterium]
HPMFAGLHEVARDGERILAASTSIDAVVGIETNGTPGESWWPREDAVLQNHLSVEPLAIDKSLDNRLLYLEGEHLRNKSHLHLNAVAEYQGRIFVLFNAYGMVYDVTNKKIVLEDPSIFGCHNLLIQNDRIFINDTRGRRLMIYDMNGKLVKAIELLDFPEVAAIHKKCGLQLGDYLVKMERNPFTKALLKLLKSVIGKVKGLNKGRSIARPIFVRGLAPLSGDRVLIGFSPATIVEVDYKRNKLLSFYQYSDNVEVCPHGLTAIE